MCKKNTLSIILTVIFLSKLIAMDVGIAISNFEGARIAMVKSTCPKAKIKTLNFDHQNITDKNYKVIPVEVSCPIALQVPQPVFISVQPILNFQKYHYKASSRTDGFINHFYPPPQV